MRRVWTWIAVALAAILVLVLAAVIAVPFLVDTPRIQSLIANTASQALGRPVRFSSVSVSVIPRPAVVLRDLEVAEDPKFGKTPFLKLERAEVRLRFWPLLRLRVELGDFVLKEPVISLVQAADGTWNVATLGGPAEAPPARPKGPGGPGPGAAGVIASQVKIEDGVVVYESRTGGEAQRYRVEDLDLTLTPSAGPLGFRGNARVTPGDLVLRISEGTIGLNGSRTVTGAPVRGTVALEGKQVRELVAAALGPEPAIAGGLKGALTLGGTVGKPRAAGEVELTDVTITQRNPQCPDPKRRTLALEPVKLNLTYEDLRVTVRPVTTAIGKGTITTNLVATLGTPMRAELGDLALKAVPLDKVLVDFLCQGYAVTGPLDLTGSAAAQPAALWTTLDGKGRLRVGAGKVVGAQALALLDRVVRLGGALESVLGGELPAGALDSALDYDSITATYTITNGVVSTRDLTLSGRALKATAAGTYALASGAMNVELNVTASRRQLRARVTGTAAAPKIAIAPGSLLREGEQRRIEEGLKDILRKLR
ncbi:MAG TPA: AsmA-like C-terminal region-containing protein [Methylomirabilota bacterium]|nr:AsmA-like C-terminal region-containing protein [Methylomirabilota bacterium]